MRTNNTNDIKYFSFYRSFGKKCDISVSKLKEEKNKCCKKIKNIFNDNLFKKKCNE